MSWLTLLDASFRGVPFQVESISDKGEKSLAVHEYPYRPGAEVEDLGRKARVIPVKAVFWGLSYKSGVEALVRALERDGKGELVHPVFGSVEVCIRSWEVSHDAERVNYATVSFEAVEAGPDNPFFAGQSARSLAEQARDALLSGLQGAVGGAASGLMATLGEVAGKAANFKNAVLAELDGLLAVYDEGRQVARTATAWLDMPLAFVADLSACVASAASTATSGAEALTGFASLSRLSAALPRLDISTGRTSGDYATGVNAYGAGWISGPVSDAVGKAEAVLAVRAPQGGTTAAPAEAPAAGSLQTPIARASAQALLLQTQTYCTAAVDTLEAELDEPRLTPAEIESLTGNARGRVRDCLDAVAAAWPPGRAHALCEGLRDAAQAMQQMGEAALNARPPLVTHLAATPGNFHLLAHRLYGDYTRAAQLARINPQVRNPNFIAQGQELLVYAR
ncbi:DNA circularization protein [Desulfovibrio sp. SGI.169]|uniref:DNA circularization protein n=1 Tax=Desulfovibrio sp. SGI.169 TaxID=3420561 RepID=UPI003D04767B